MAKILICDDEMGLRMVLSKYAKNLSHQVVEAENGQEAVNLVKSEEFNMIIMDAMMPVMDGYEAVKEIRQLSDTPIIMLTALGEEYNKVLGFELGIDDYVVKPFSSKEVMMRVDAILRRYDKYYDKAEENDVYKNEGLLVDMTAYKLVVNGEEMSLTLKAYELLFYLIKNRNIVLSREKLVTELWGYDYFGDDRTLDTHIKMLRKALGEYGTYIKTLRGLGYKFDEK